MRKRRERTLSGDEITLWTHVARTVKPFAGRIVPPLPVDQTEPRPEPVSPTSAAKSPERAAAVRGTAKTVPMQTAPPPLAPLERRTLTALKRGRQPLEAVLDLHGLRQAEAHEKLRGFLSREQALGSRLVLVITGKGAAGDAVFGDERGVLKRIVPHWLRMADLRSIVIGFEDAALNHGGSGALYVRLRRLREHGP
jgi:DNA-nicking Smr family endonuclease